MSDKSKPLTEEALRTQIFPGIAFRGEGFERRAWIIGTAHDVWQVIDAHRDLDSIEAMVAEGDLNEQQIRLALAYYERFPEEIDEAIALQRRPLAQLRAEYPFIKVYSPAKNNADRPNAAPSSQKLKSPSRVIPKARGALGRSGVRVAELRPE